MTQITVQNGKIITENNKIGTGSGCCCVEEYDCDTNCNKTITVNWSNNGESGTLTYTIADRGAFVLLPGKFRVSSSINCRNAVDGKWSISVVFCAVAPYGGGWAAAIISALADGCPPDGPVTWTTIYFNPVADASASIS